jgi:CARDB
MGLNRRLIMAVLGLVVITLIISGTRPTPLQYANAQSSSVPRPPLDEFYRLVRPNAGVIRRNTITQTTATLPDLDVQFIDRTPRYKWCFITPSNPCTGVKLWPAAGESVIFTGHIANRGGSVSGAFTYTWYIDGVQRAQATGASLAAGAEAVVTFPWTWATGAHSAKLVLDTPGAITEVSEQNNSLQDQTNALTLGIYVEQAVYTTSTPMSRNRTGMAIPTQLTAIHSTTGFSVMYVSGTACSPRQYPPASSTGCGSTKLCASPTARLAAILTIRLPSSLTQSTATESTTTSICSMASQQIEWLFRQRANQTLVVFIVCQRIKGCGTTIRAYSTS